MIEEEDEDWSRDFFRGGLLGAGWIVSNSHHTALGLDYLLSLGAYYAFVFYFALSTKVSFYSCDAYD